MIFKHPYLKLTVRVFCGLNAHVRFSFVHATLPLSALLLHGCLGPVLSVDVGQVGRGVVVRLQRIVILNLWRVVEKASKPSKIKRLPVWSYNLIIVSVTLHLLSSLHIFVHFYCLEK